MSGQLYSYVVRVTRRAVWLALILVIGFMPLIHAMPVLAAPMAKDCTGLYRVRSGGTIANVASITGWTTAEILLVNPGLSVVTLLRAQQVVILPRCGSSPTLGATQPMQGSTTRQSAVVAAGTYNFDGGRAVLSRAVNNSELVVVPLAGYAPKAVAGVPVGNLQALTAAAKMSLVAYIYIAAAPVIFDTTETAVRKFETWVATNRVYLPSDRQPAAIAPIVSPAQNGDRPGFVAVPEVPGLEAPGHIRNHPRGDITAEGKLAAWNKVMNFWNGGGKPDWCGQRPSDGSWLVVVYNLTIQRVPPASKVYAGLGVLLNGSSGGSTSFSELKPGGPDRRPTNGTAANFITKPCPPRPWNPAY